VPAIDECAKRPRRRRRRGILGMRGLRIGEAVDGSKGLVVAIKEKFGRRNGRSGRSWRIDHGINSLAEGEGR
jgi:hypothetical protein